MEGMCPNSFYKAGVTLIPKTDKDPTKKGEMQASKKYMDAKIVNEILPN